MGKPRRPGDPSPDPTGESRLLVASLAKRYGRAGGRWALRRVSFALRPGEVVGLIGPNGAGKTTTMAIIAGLIAPTSGAVHFNGRLCPVREPRPWLGAWVGEPGFYGHLRGRAHLRATAGLRGIRLDGAECEARLAAVGLDHTEGRQRVRTYSTGMRRRLALATALVGEPEVLLLDEPTSGLDPDGIRMLLDTIVSVAEGDVSILVSSHRLAEIETICDRVVLLAEGVSSELATTGTERVVRLRCSDLRLAERLLQPSFRVARLGRALVVDGASRISEIVALLDGHGVAPSAVEEAVPTLEERYLLMSAGDAAAVVDPTGEDRLGAT